MKLPALPGFDKQAFDKYLKNTGWLMFGKVTNMIVGFAIAKYLGRVSYGDFSVIDAITTIVTAICMLGFDNFIIREILHAPGRRSRILGTSFLLRAALSLLMVPVTLGLYSLLRSATDIQGNSLLLPLAVLSFIPFFKSMNVIDSWFQSQVQSRYVVNVQNVCLLLSSVVKAALIIYQADFIWFAASQLFDSAILALGLLIVYRISGERASDWSFDVEIAKDLLSKSWPLIISAVMVTLYMKIDILMLKSWKGSAETGSYAAAAKISESWYFIPMAIVSSVLPAMISIRKSDPQKYIRRLQNLYDLLVGISLPAALLISFSGEWIIHTIYGNLYPGAGLMLQIHIWSGIFVFLGTASSQYLLAEGYNKISFVRTAIGAVVNILLNIWLIPRYGGVGASVATLAAYFAATFSAFLFKRARTQGALMIKSLFLISLFQKIAKREP